jgi:hypothetical protein
VLELRLSSRPQRLLESMLRRLEALSTRLGKRPPKPSLLRKLPKILKRLPKSSIRLLTLLRKTPLSARSPNHSRPLSRMRVVDMAVMLIRKPVVSCVKRP